MPEWLAHRVGPNGYVLATDLDTGWLPPAGADGYHVRRHDVGMDPPPGEDFDLIHSRLVLVHVPERARALAGMVESLVPGGWLYAEDADPALQPLSCLDEYGPQQRLANKLHHGSRVLPAQRGVDLAYGRTLPRLLRDAGLIDVNADAYFPISSPACTPLETATVEEVREALIADGLATEDEIRQHLENVSTGRLDLATAPLIAVWGQKPLMP